MKPIQDIGIAAGLVVLMVMLMLIAV